jgi:bifunctional UDP-N-acetylglucosamine pyrophosphorylase/glucosamine-1-phosphate N-acetyltransferase/UDP-N-acetylglucosamine pyrophosphorylase
MDKKIGLVMAAGKGTRMKSDLPKVLFPVCGRPMVEYVLDVLEEVGVDRIVVIVGYRAELVREALRTRTGLEFVEQTEQLGTGHAVMVCRDHLKEHEGPVFVIAGDSPMIQADSVRALLEDYERKPAACILGTAHKDEPFGLGRIVRSADGQFSGIVEERDATEEQRQITEVNMSYYVFRCPDLLGALEEIRPDNCQGEYYITDVPGVLLKEGKAVRALPVLKPCEVLSINTVDELKTVEAAMQEAGGVE